MTGKTRELVVSAGESVEVTLPRNAVELNAFVVPAPTEGKAEAVHWSGALFIKPCHLSTSDISRMNLHEVGCDTGMV